MGQGDGCVCGCKMEGGIPTFGCEHPPEHPAGTRALPPLSACLCREEAAAQSITPTSLLSRAHTKKYVPAHMHAHKHTHTCTPTCNFSRSITEETSIDTHQTRRPLFPLGWEGHQKLSNHHSEKTLLENKTERIRVKEATWLTPWVPPSASQPHRGPESKLVQVPQPSPRERGYVYNRKDTSTRCQATGVTKSVDLRVPVNEGTVQVTPQNIHKAPCPGGNNYSPVAMNLKTGGILDIVFVLLVLAQCLVHSVNI